jgi:hypothetical protein
VFCITTPPTKGKFVHTENRQLAVRSYLAAGVAIVGATAIAVSPMTPPMPHVQMPAVHLPSVQEMQVGLTSLADPFAAYGQVFDAAIANLQSILGTAANNPTPILTKVLSNQLASVQALLGLLPTAANPSSTNLSTGLSQALASQPGVLQELVAAIQTAISGVSTALQTTVPPILQSALTDLQNANVEGAVNNVLLAGFAALFPVTGVITPALNVVAAPLQTIVNAINTIGPVGTVISNPLQNVVNVLNAVGGDFLPPATNADLAVAGLLGPVIEGVAATGTAIQGVIDAAGTGNAGNVLGAIIDAPAVVAGGVLNGGVGPDLSSILNVGIPGIPILAGGLLTQFGYTGVFNLPGPVSELQALQSLIAGALKPPVITTAVPDEASTLKTTDTSATPGALPSLKSTLVGVKTPHLVKLKLFKDSATDPESAATTKKKTPDAKVTSASSDKDASSTTDSSSATKDPGSTTTGSSDTTKGASVKPTHEHGRQAGDTGGRHARSHDSDGSGNGASSGGRHHAA